MKTVKIYLFIFVILVLFISCNNSVGFVVNKEQTNRHNKYSLIFNGVKEFPLDDETSYLIKYMQLIDTDTITYFSFINNYNNSIYFYDYASSSFIRKIKYEKEGNNGVGKIQGYYYVNEDSIFIYSYETQRLFLTNSHAEVVSKYSLYDESKSTKENLIPSPYVHKLSPLRKYGNYIISGGFLPTETSSETATNRPVIEKFNIINQTSDFIINYPEQYQKYNWAGGFTYRMPFFDIGNQSLIVSFAADHYLLEYSLISGEQKRHYAGSSSIKEIRSFPESKDSPINEDKAWEWYMYNPSYQGVFYDKYKNLYYRMARLPVKEYNQGENDNKKPLIIIILDANFNYLGEVLFPKDIKYEVPNCFISKDGFNIQVLTDNEDKLTYYQYNFIINEK